MTTPTVFVTAATGTQGEAVARQLRDLGWGVHTVARNPASPAAQALAARGVKITRGDWRDQTALETSLAGCQLLWLALMPDLTDPSSEPAFAKSILDAARAAGIRHVVYSGAIHTDQLPGFDPSHWSAPFRLAKHAVDEVVSQAAFPVWTVLRPGTFMANFLQPKVAFQYPRAAETGVFSLAMPRDTPFPLTDQEDIARLAVAAFQDPERFHGKDIAFCSEKIMIADAITALAAASGRDIKAEHLDERAVAEADPSVKYALDIQLSLRQFHTLVDADELGRWGFTGGTFQAFLDRERQAVDATYGQLPRASG